MSDTLRFPVSIALPAGCKLRSGVEGNAFVVPAQVMHSLPNTILDKYSMSEWAVR